MLGHWVTLSQQLVCFQGRRHSSKGRLREGREVRPVLCYQPVGTRLPVPSFVGYLWGAHRKDFLYSCKNAAYPRRSLVTQEGAYGEWQLKNRDQGCGSLKGEREGKEVVYPEHLLCASTGSHTCLGQGSKSHR